MNREEIKEAFETTLGNVLAEFQISCVPSRQDELRSRLADASISIIQTAAAAAEAQARVKATVSLCPHTEFVNENGGPLCQFEPRYSKGPANPQVYDGVVDFDDYATTSAIEDAIEQTRSVTYIHDVCVSCGRTVKRD